MFSVWKGHFDSTQKIHCRHLEQLNTSLCALKSRQHYEIKWEKIDTFHTHGHLTQGGKMPQLCQNVDFSFLSLVIIIYFSWNKHRHNRPTLTRPASFLRRGLAFRPRNNFNNLAYFRNLVGHIFPKGQETSSKMHTISDTIFGYIFFSSTWCDPFCSEC